MADVYDDRPDTTIPIGRPITADDLDGFALYSMGFDTSLFAQWLGVPEVREQFAMIQRNIELEARLIDDLLEGDEEERRNLELDDRPTAGERRAFTRLAEALHAHRAELRCRRLVVTHLGTEALAHLDDMGDIEVAADGTVLEL